MLRIPSLEGEYLPMAIFITGGAGYIGSHLVRALVAVGEKPVVMIIRGKIHSQNAPERPTWYFRFIQKNQKRF